MTPEQQTTNERADVLMHNGQQYVRVDYLTRAQAEIASLREVLAFMPCECDPHYAWITGKPHQCSRCAALGKQP